MSVTRAPGWCARLGVLGLALVTAVGPAQASGPRTGLARLEAPAVREVVVVLPIAGGLDERLARTLDERVADGLRRGQFTVIAGDEVRGRVPAGACEADCLRELGAATGARYVVRTEVTVEGRDYNVRLVLLRADGGEAVVTSAESCEICGHEELADRVGEVASALRRKLGLAVEPPPRLRVLTRPDGSEVLLDGVVIGVTPLDITVAAGEHDVVIQRPGFVAHRRHFRVSDGATETIAAELGPVPTTTPPPARRRALAPAGWASLAIGLAATGAGVGLIAVDERPIRRDCSGENVDAAGNCKYRLDTLGGGVALTIVGVAAIAVGVALVVIDRRRGRAAAGRLSMHAGGLGVRF